MTRSIRFGHADCGGGMLHYAEAGDPAAPLIICLHGFPEYWAAWRDVMELLAGRFHLVVPDQRGFNLSFKPEGVESYRTHHMVADLAALADRFTPGRPFVLAGHDWGAAVAYAFAIAYPGRVSRLVVANGVHPACFQRAIFDDPEQRAASQYINKLRAPGVAARLAEDNYARMLKMIEGNDGAKWMDETARAGYLQAWGQPGAMEASLNWYRASPVIVPDIGAAAPESKLLAMPPGELDIRVPHLVIWGDEDTALRPSCLDGLDAYAPDLRIERITGAGHWILHEKPVEVAEAMTRFIG